MAKIELYSWQFCPFAQRARIVLAVKQINHELHEVDITQPYPERFLEMNPVGKVPTVVYDGKSVYESEVVCEFLDELFPKKPVLPIDPYNRAISRLFISYGTSTFIPALYTLLTNQEPEKDDELKQKALDSWKWVNDFLVKHNPKGTYLFDEPTLADYAYGPFFQRWRIVEYYRYFEVPLTQEYTRVLKWRDALLELPIVQSTGHAHEKMVKLYADYARGYDNGKIPPGQEHSAFDLTVPLEEREMPARGLRLING
jgi:glutathione S-transferase